MTRSANVRGARRLLSVKVHPDTFTALGSTPSTTASAILDAWATDASTPGPEGTEVEEDSAAKLGPGQSAAERGAMTDPDATP